MPMMIEFCFYKALKGIDICSHANKTDLQSLSLLQLNRFV